MGPGSAPQGEGNLGARWPGEKGGPLCDLLFTRKAIWPQRDAACPDLCSDSGHFSGSPQNLVPSVKVISPPTCPFLLGPLVLPILAPPPPAQCISGSLLC